MFVMICFDSVFAGFNPHISPISSAIAPLRRRAALR